MEDEQTKKTQYINEAIISKGYNPDDLSNFIMKEICISINDISFEKLKIMIDNFKNKGLVDLYKTVKQQNDNNKSDNFEEQLFYPEVFDIKTKTPKTNKLLDLEKEKQKINIKISELKNEKSESGGIFGKNKNLYKIECDAMKSNVKRTYSDFEWLRGMYVMYYPLRIIPPLIKEANLLLEGIVDKNDDKEKVENKKIKHLNQFIHTLLKKKLFRTSSLLYNFITLDNEEFKKYKESVNKRRYELSQNFDNFKNMNGKIHCEFNKDKIAYVEKISLGYQKISNIYTKLEENLNKVISDLNNLSYNMKEISDRFQELTENLKYFQHNGRMSNAYIQLNTIFGCWSSSLKNQSEFFNEDFLQLFKFFNLQIKETDILHKQLITQKKNYESKGLKLLKKKEELFYQGDVSKWGVDPSEKKLVEKCSNEKTICFEKMLCKETNSLKEEKKTLAIYINLINRQFDKLLKNQSDELLIFFDNLKNSHQIMVGDAYNLIKLCNLNMK
jgi:methyl-accepting chemotaxis protein